MAEHQIEARILLRYDTISNWLGSSLILKKGEAAIAAYPTRNTLNNTGATPENTPPAIGIKIGDGVHYFDELPWVQAVAADIYPWAKQVTKPIYDASEIVNLDTYISQHGSSGGGGTSGSDYRFTYNSNTHKYVFQYYDSSLQAWINTDSEIDFSDIYEHISYLEGWANGSRIIGPYLEQTLVLSIRDEVLNQLEKLDVDDEAVPHEFVTQVTEINGKINVSRSGLAASDITSGILPVEFGGTGMSEIPNNEVLIGNNRGTLSTKAVVTRFADGENTDLATIGAITNYVTSATAGLTGAMHFIGEATVIITDNSSVDPQIDGYNFRQAEPGDVILGINKEEYVWTGTNWRLLGDEGSYIVKGSITNVDIADGANIDISKIANLSNLLNTKVDKVDGKTLTSNDFTNEYKQKLEDIENQAQKNLIEHIYINDTEVRPTIIDGVSNVISFRMSSLTEEEAEQLRQTSEKVQNIEANAQVNKIESISIDGDKQTPDAEKNINLELNQYTNIIESISLNNGAPLSIVGKNVNINLDESALAFEVITGAEVPGSDNNDRTVNVTNKKLQLTRIAKTGSIYDITNTSNSYTIVGQQQEDFIILNCGSSTQLIDNITQSNN